LVDKLFYIEGEKIFDVGLRFSLVSLGGRYNVKVQAVNEQDKNRVRVVTSGSSVSVMNFYKHVESNDVRFFKDGTKYSITEMEKYTGPSVDYVNYINSLNIEQVGKMLYTAGNKLPTIETKIDSIDTNIKQMSESLKSIDRKFPSQEKPE
jgi:acylphosphatase